MLNAENNINIQNETESHEESSGFLSSKSTDVYDYSSQSALVGSNVSAGSVDITSGKDTNVKSSNKYDTVTDQSGIYAGKEGFDIHVEDNTDLKGGIISSEAEAEKNKISTGKLETSMSTEIKPPMVRL